MTWLDKIRLCLIYTVAVTLIVMAVAFSMLRTVLPHATGYVEDVEQALSRQIGLPVSIARIDADMYWLVPRLKLIDVVIYDKDSQRELLRLEEAFFALAPVNSLRRWSLTVGDVSLVGADLYIERYADNRWRIQGVEFSPNVEEVSGNNTSSEIIAAIKNTSFSLLESDIHWQDYRLQSEPLDFIGANIYVEEYVGDHSLEINLQLPEIYGESFRLVVKTSDDIAHLSDADLDVYIQGKKINIDQSLSVLDVAEKPEIKGIFSGELWLTIQDRRISDITIDALVTQLEVNRENRGRFSIDSLEGKIDWGETADGWRFNGRDLHLVKQAVAWQQPASVALVQDSAGLSASASYLRSQDLISIAGVFLDEEQAAIAGAYQLNHFGGDLYNLSMYLPAEDSANIKLSSVFENLYFQLPDSDISFSGIDGSLLYSDARASIKLLSEKVTMDFGELFQQPLKVDLAAGMVHVEHENNHWQISADNFYALNSEVEINTRLELVKSEGSAWFADIQSDFRNASGRSIQKYYPVPIMSADLLQWLDVAVTDGAVDSGSFIIHGDLNRFPYKKNEGVMQAVFDARDLNLKFLQGWPTLNNLNAHVRFHNSSMSVTDAGGETNGGEMTRAEALIPDLNNPRLFINGTINAPAQDLQQYVWDSGLDSILGAAMKQFQASGETELQLSLEVPLDKSDNAIQARGSVQFMDNELYFPIMDYALDNVSGRLLFSGDQLQASDIKATFETAPVSIDVTTAGEGKARSEMIFYIKGNLSADGLLKKFAWIPDGWVEGASYWDVAVHLPKVANDYEMHVEMSSELEGTSVHFSDAVSKIAPASLPIELELKALQGVLQLDIKAGEKFSLLARRDEEALWSFMLDSNLLRGKGSLMEDLAKDSTVTMDFEYVDLYSLFNSSKKSGNSVSLLPTFFPSLNLKTGVLVWNDWEFNNVQLKTSWHSHGMLINSLSLQSPSLQITGRGSWLTSWQNKHESNFKFFINSDDFGRALSSLKLGDSIKNGKQQATVDWRWFNEPYNFSWQTVQGSSSFKIEEGEISELDPGTGGRFVGLFNVFKLFDRFSLNFKDVFGEGFVFDSIEGDFEFNDGYASTKNIEVDGAVAAMKLGGKIGMVDKDYDLTMQVKPHSSAAAFTTGTLAGGPVLGAGLVLLNKLLGLEKGSYNEYEITGLWIDPKIEKIGGRSAEKNSKQ
ncbi:MAG: DUF3971 domain-containing protein [Gammaproteobacteria bacterium]|nr:DUF3971 domain-containing protein [Gammaproteobacteria bacterium]